MIHLVLAIWIVEKDQTTTRWRGKTAAGCGHRERSRRNATIKRITSEEKGGTTARISDWRTTIAAGARTWVCSKRLNRADVGGVEKPITTAQDQRLIFLESAVGKADAWSKIVLVGVCEITTTRCILTRHLDRTRRGIEVALLIKSFRGGR